MFRKFIFITVLVSFLGALALIANPALHAHAHHQASAKDHHGSEECHICHILGHFVIDQAVSCLMVLVNTDFFILTNDLYQTPQLTYLPSALIPRAPPIV